MRNCTRLHYYIWKWDEFAARRNNNLSQPWHPRNFCKVRSKKAAMRAMKRLRADQVDCRGIQKGRGVHYCFAYWRRGKIVEQKQ